MFYGVMSKCGLLFVSCILTTRTSHVCVPTDLSTSRCFFFMVDYVMSKCVCITIDVFISAMTSMCGISLFCTSRCGNNCVVAVSCCREFLVCGVVTT